MCVPRDGVKVWLPAADTGEPLIVTVPALRTSHLMTALWGPTPGGTLIMFGLISKTTILGRKVGKGAVGVTTGGVTVEEEDETVIVTADDADPAELLAVNV
ncbi:MAG: hypothetical protein NT082_06000, partial [Chloroflexi bacterium]|nr:hypothetical protein [Chloroflexota bacterium]